MYIQVAGDTHSRACIPQLMKNTGFFGEGRPFSCNISKQIFKYKTTTHSNENLSIAIQEKLYLDSPLITVFIRTTHTKHFRFHFRIFVCQVIHLLYNLEKRQRYL